MEDLKVHSGVVISLMEDGTYRIEDLAEKDDEVNEMKMNTFTTLIEKIHEDLQKEKRKLEVNEMVKEIVLNLFSNMNNEESSEEE
jgi:hypothetical protein